MRSALFTACVLVAASAAACASSGVQQVAATADAASEHAIERLTWSEVEEKMKDGAVLVDSRRDTSYAEGHIAGAVSIPWKDKGAYAQLPKDKGAQLIFYCGGPYCKASLKGAQAAMGMGYTQVAEYRGGYPEWSRFVGSGGAAKSACAGCADGKTCDKCAAKKAKCAKSKAAKKEGCTKAKSACAGCADGKTCGKCAAKKGDCKGCSGCPKAAAKKGCTGCPGAAKADGAGS